MKPKAADPTEATVKTHIDLALREKQDNSPRGRGFAGNCRATRTTYARRHGLPTGAHRLTRRTTR